MRDLGGHDQGELTFDTAVIGMEIIQKMLKRAEYAEMSKKSISLVVRLTGFWTAMLFSVAGRDVAVYETFWTLTSAATDDDEAWSDLLTMILKQFFAHIEGNKPEWLWCENEQVARLFVWFIIAVSDLIVNEAEFRLNVLALLTQIKRKYRNG